MNKNFVWLGFLGIVALTTLWYSGIAAYRYYHYSTLNTSTPASTVTWTINAHSENAYTLTGSYHFEAQGKAYTGATEFSNQISINRYAAEQSSREHAAQRWKVWFNSANPEHSSLQKRFPFKECTYAIVLWGLLLYFLWLGYYVERFKT